VAAAALKLGSIAGIAGRAAGQAGMHRQLSGIGSKRSSSSAGLQDCNNNGSFSMRKKARNEEPQQDLSALLNNLGQRIMQGVAAAEAAALRAEKAGAATAEAATEAQAGAEAAAQAAAAVQLAREDVRDSAAAAKGYMRKALVACNAAQASAAGAAKAEGAAGAHAKAAPNSARDARCAAWDIARS
jgi:hypothetical protein